jgi:adenosylcobinamide-GDP ribazoletransferase
MIRRFLGAIQFLTVLPVRGATAPAGECAGFFPLVGALLGLAGAGLWLVLQSANASVAALLVIAFWTFLTGALHEDGLADVADAVRAHRTPEKILAILKDSRIGTFGALALIFSVALRWAGLMGWAAATAASDPRRFALGMAAAVAVPRAAMVYLAWRSRPVGDGLGAHFQKTLHAPAVYSAVLIGVGFALLAGLRLGLELIGVTGLVLMAAHKWFHERIGGVTGDCLGATAQAVETMAFVLLSWPFFIQ